MRIVAINIPEVSEYVEKIYFRCLETSKYNADLKCSRAMESKIEKVTSGRYGLKSVKFVEKLRRACGSKKSILIRGIL